ncbi:MAG: hypothetical protein E7441_01625 [Ruminococcaceae bacterium]|nr:hypothetical protein [Oscillospiraceae bacterium]
MGIAAVEYQKYIDICRKIENDEEISDIRREISRLEGELKKAEKEYRQIANESDAVIDSMVDSDIAERFGDASAGHKNELEKLEKKNNSYIAALTPEQRRYPEILRENREFVASFHKYREQYENDASTLSEMFPQRDIKSDIEGWFKEILYGHSTKWEFDEIKKMDIPGPVESDGHTYGRTGVFSRIKDIFYPFGYNNSVPSHKTVYILSGISYILPVVLVLLWLLGKIPVLLTVVGASLVWSMCCSYLGVRMDGDPLEVLGKDRALLYHFALNGDTLVEEYTRDVLNIPEMGPEQLEKELAQELNAFKERENEIRAELKKLDAQYADIKNEQGQIDMLFGQLEADAQGVRLSRALNKAPKDRTDHENMIVREYEEKRLRAIERRNAAEQKFKNNISASSALKSELWDMPDKVKAYEKDMQRQIQVAWGIAILLEGESALNKLRHQVDSDAELEATEREKLRNKYLKERRCRRDKAQQRCDVLRNQLGEVQRQLGEVEALRHKEMEDARAFISGVESRMEMSNEETKCVLSPCTFVMSSDAHHGPCGPKLSKFVHNGKPSVLLYTLDGSKTDATTQLSPLLERMLLSFFTTNSMLTVCPQKIVDTITGAKNFKSKDYENLVEVVETSNQIRKLTDSLDELAEMIVTNGVRSLDELNERRVNDSGVPVANNVVYFVLPSDSGAASRVMSEEMWRLVRRGPNYGFLPIFLIERRCWEEYENNEDKFRHSSDFYTSLFGIIDSEQIYDVDLTACTLKPHNR